MYFIMFFLTEKRRFFRQANQAKTFCQVNDTFLVTQYANVSWEKVQSSLQQWIILSLTILILHV